MENQFGYFNLGKNTATVSFQLHQETRQKLVNALKTEKIDFPKPFVVLQGGASEYRHDTDHEILFRQESYFHYLFGVKEPDFFGAIDVESGKSILFIPRLPESFSVWMGKIFGPEHYAKVYLVDFCYYVDEIDKVLKDMGCKTVLVLYGQNTDSDLYHVPATFKGIENFTVDKEFLFPILRECRVTKTPRELEVMRFAAKISCDAHSEVMKHVRPGMVEYELESLFRHHVYTHGGCRHLSYTCICGSGPNSAILHYGHAGAPNSRVIKDGDILMFDMGGEYYCYGSDISRSFPVNGKFTHAQKEIYLSVLAAQQAVMDSMKEGVFWPDMHRLANKVVCEQLKKYNFLKGDIDEIIKNHVGALFMPHGLGHLLGIDTHDPGGYTKDTVRPEGPGIKSLRLGRVLQENMVVTVEPGIYFVRSLLEPAFENPQVNQYLNIEKIKQYLDFGGIRIEDDVIVLKNGIENMSASCPRDIEGIEALMASK